MTNDELSRLVDTSDEWILERTGIRERRIARRRRRSATSRCRPRGRRSPTRGVDAAEIDLLICATVTPDMLFPTTSALMADTLGRDGRRRLRPARRAAPASCTPSPRPTGCSPRASRRRRSSSAATCSRRSSTGRPLDARPLRRRRGRGRAWSRSSTAASSASSSAPTAAAASTSATRAAARGTSTTPTLSSR